MAPPAHPLSLCSVCPDTNMFSRAEDGLLLITGCQCSSQHAWQADLMPRQSAQHALSVDDSKVTLAMCDRVCKVVVGSQQNVNNCFKTIWNIRSCMPDHMSQWHCMLRA